MDDHISRAAEALGAARADGHDVARVVASALCAAAADAGGVEELLTNPSSWESGLVRRLTVGEDGAGRRDHGGPRCHRIDCRAGDCDLAWVRFDLPDGAEQLAHTARAEGWTQYPDGTWTCPDHPAAAGAPWTRSLGTDA